MANAVLNSNSSSALISALDAVSSAKNPFEYSYASKGTLGYSHVPSHARVISTSQCTSKGFGQNNDFPILKSGHLENAFVKMVVKNESDAAADYNAFIGNLQVAEIQLITQGKVICSSKPFGRACLMSDAPYGRKKNQEKGYGLQAIRHADIADNAEIKPYSIIEGAKLGKSASAGPFARLRTGAELKEDAHVGNFVEMKKTVLGKGSKAGHLSYLGDAQIGAGVNIGAGTITCNYDGVNKFVTTIEDGVFVGSDTQLIAPVTIGKNATLGAGSTIAKDVGEGELVITRVKQRHIAGWQRPVKLSK